MKTKRVNILMIIASLLFSLTAMSAEKIKVVTSFSIIGDLIKQVGKDHVDVISLVGPDENAHMYQPTPNDVKNIRQATLVVVHGLHFDDWARKLMKSANYKGAVLVVTRGIKPIVLEESPLHDDRDGHDHGNIDPHAWHDIANVMRYVRNIEMALSKLDSEHQKAYQENARSYIQQLENLDNEINRQIASIPKDKRRILTAHNAFAYLARRYNLTMVALQGVSPHSKASAHDMAKIIRQAKAANVQVMFLENVTDDRALKQISKESGVKMGGTLYSDALSKSSGPAKSYIDLMRANTTQIITALKP